METHTQDSLHARNRELHRFAEEQQLQSYDGIGTFYFSNADVLVRVLSPQPRFRSRGAEWHLEVHAFTSERESVPAFLLERGHVLRGGSFSGLFIDARTR